ncbi:hypothetical protein ACVHNB_35655 [Streptomyces sp. YJ-C3]
MRRHAARLLGTDDVRTMYFVHGRSDAWDCERAVPNRPVVFRRHALAYWLFMPLWLPWWCVAMLTESPGLFLMNRSLPSGAGRRAEAVARSRGRMTHRHFGGWQSDAGTFLKSLQPRSRCDFHTVLVVTGSQLAVIYLDASLRRLERPEAAELGFVTPLASVPWVRDIREADCDEDYEIGFADGSWQAARMTPLDKKAVLFGEAMPHVIDHREPIPDFVATDSD